MTTPTESNGAKEGGEVALRCATCSHWQKCKEYETGYAQGLGRCGAVPMFWDMTEWRDVDDDYRRVFKPEAEKITAFAQDGSDYSAKLFTRPEHGCTMHSAAFAAGGKVEAPSAFTTEVEVVELRPGMERLNFSDPDWWIKLAPGRYTLSITPGVGACDPAQLIREWVRLKRAMDKAPNQAAYEQAEVEWQAVNRKFIDYADGVPPVDGGQQ